MLNPNVCDSPSQRSLSTLDNTDLNEKKRISLFGLKSENSQTKIERRRFPKKLGLAKRIFSTYSDKQISAATSNTALLKRKRNVIFNIATRNEITKNSPKSTSKHNIDNLDQLILQEFNRHSNNEDKEAAELDYFSIGVNMTQLTLFSQEVNFSIKDFFYSEFHSRLLKACQESANFK